LALGLDAFFYRKGLKIGAKGTEFMECGEGVQEFGGSFANIVVPMVAFVLKNCRYDSVPDFLNYLIHVFIMCLYFSERHL
jgi:hypothetical protein